MLDVQAFAVDVCSVATAFTAYGLMMLTWVAVIAVAVWVVARSLGGQWTDSARQILDERYARGELSTEEYRERLQHLR